MGERGKGNRLEIYFDRPATAWEETLPVGNGSLGGMSWGGIQEEVIGLNEESLWSGYERDRNNPQAFDSLEKVRQLIFEGRNFEAEPIIWETMLGEYGESYLPLGSLHLKYHGLKEETVRAYERRLDLEEAIVTEKFQADGVSYGRELFASYPGKAFISSLTSDKPVMDLEIYLESPLRCAFLPIPDGLSFTGRCPEHLDPSYARTGEEAIIWGYRGRNFSGSLAVAECDGQVLVEKGRIRVQNASRLVITLAAVRPMSLQGAYTDWKAAHIQDYQSIFKKVELYLGPQKEVPTDERLRALREGGEDNGLFALYFQYGRYLMISSSRKGSLPANLQGIWSWDFQAPWSCNWTTNINLEMNYWPALGCGLEECLEPYFTFVEKLARHGKETARVNYHCRGSVQHHNADGWYCTNPMGVVYGQEGGSKASVSWSMWPMGLAWLAQEFYSYYEYVQDLDFLEKEAYPLFREAALFLVDWLVPYKGRYVTCPSTSPENTFYDEQGRVCSVTLASAMDMELTRDVFTHYLDCCRILKLQDPFMEEVKERLDKLADVQIGSFGQILEWFREYREVEPGHRHVSHLYGLFPSELWAGKPDLERAARISLEHRLSHGGGYTGWSCAWIINLMAVLGDGEGAWDYLHTLLTRSTYPNLWDAHEPFQIDGNFGGIAGMANLLVQDRGGVLKFLPALPKQFREGFVKGLRIKGRKAVDIRWSDGVMEECRIWDLDGA